MDDEATSNFKASSYFEGIYVASFQAAIWIFALKFWVLSIRLKVVSQKGNPESLRSIAQILYIGGIFVSTSLGIALTVST